ncbi:GTP-binding protein [Grosmannia clavigera kw1407]|uniref:GTP-binding protein n=1 Tax=Grosmannia clavigera (strain kw1407 / UAMH 11150) TaxID=655863 RepID=F0XIM2_GROCL|nr:GTP-binding protein [Grosmannia clavigera kw1407]EFX02466.1 GTP-binding protein [Grosmannia clavigera kw1407]
MSVFTFDPNPPRVSSLWLLPAKLEDQGLQPNGTVAHSLLSDYGVTRLPPEPEDGPVEYKLHLLLRPRRAYKPLSYFSASLQAKIATDPKYLQKTRVVGSSTAGQTRQDRCQHLTTQLLWRLRQSSPYHASVASQDIDVPVLPDGVELSSLPVALGRLAPGLEESRGALYEIGVADDGTLIGIAKDEMDQSVATLRWMAASLGCTAEVQRMVAVGECEWTADEAPSIGPETAPPKGRENLWVAEVFVRPHMKSYGSSGSNHKQTLTTLGSATTDQLRVTLTGPTGSGKSTLLGTLSTGTLDDGHGKSRLNSLKHLHELASGLTSTVTQELLGYSEDRIVNYANQNIESWIGIHDYTKDGRLVFVSDSAGHPRFRRTTLRGLIGWAPHWTILCLAAASDTAAGSAALAKAHLDLCLKLNLPLAIIITKSDLLNKESLKRTLVPIWTAVKNAGRTPQLLQSKQKSSENIRQIPATDALAIESALSHAQATSNFRAVVPVILSSTVSGDGIGMVHALLRSLPLPPEPTAQDYVGMALNPEEPESLFHIEGQYNRPASYTSSNLGELADPGYVVSGYLRFGSISVGDLVVVGPFQSEGEVGGLSLEDERTASPSSHTVLSSSHPSNSELSRIAARKAISASALNGKWHNARVISIRNLRLPVETLATDQVGTIGLIALPPETAGDDVFEPAAPPDLKPRRGMVLAIPSKHMVDSGLQLQAASGLTAFFADATIESLATGTAVTFYVASVRAQARIAKIWSGSLGDSFGISAEADGAPEDGLLPGSVFRLHDTAEADSRQDGAATTAVHGYNVRLELLNRREWIELGSQIVILEGASKEAFLLDGFIGKVVEIAD